MAEYDIVVKYAKRITRNTGTVVAHMSTGDKLKRARQAQVPRVTQAVAAEIAQVKRSAYANYESGIVQTPHRVVEALSDRWKIPQDWFYDETDSRPRIEGKLVAVERLIPCWGSVPAGDWDKPPEDPEMVDAGPYAGAGRIAVRIVGGSMHPLLDQGDLAVIHLDPSPLLNKVVLARNSDGDLTVKRLVVRDGEYALVSAKDAEQFARADNWELLGYCVGTLRSFS